MTRCERLTENIHGKPVKVPDFTRGKWKTKKPAFGV